MAADEHEPDAEPLAGLSSPLWGGVGGGGRDEVQALHTAPPPPLPLPARGRGARAAFCDRTDQPAFQPSRRGLVLGAGALAATVTLPRPLRAEGAGVRHGLSSFGELRYGADFPHFDYVNPQAPRGGGFSAQITQGFGNQAFDTFDTLNPYVFRGNGAAGVNLTFDTLMVRALDEPDALYGLVARAVEASADGLTYRFFLRPQARFHNGTRLTARDAAFSLGILKEKGHPTIAQVIRDMAEAAAEGDETLVVRFAPGRSRDLPLVIAQLPIFSAAYFAERDFEEPTLKAPLGSGPYRIGRLEVGRFVELERVPDYWGADLPVAIGQNNFDRIRYEYFRDRQVAFEAFKGGAFLYRQEYTARIWATAYDFPAVREGRVKREELPDASPPNIQGWYFNTRREIFRDPRVREAVGLCFDFPWTNRTVMYGAYTRTVSFFEKTELMARGAPSAEELALLEPLRDKLPKDVFGEPYALPEADGSGQDRTLLRRADALLKEAGCTREGGSLRLPGGKPFEFEFLDSDPVFEPVVQPFAKNLGLLGIRARQRTVDASQYQARVRDFDFDVTIRASGSDPTPGPEIRESYGSRAAGIPGSNNLAGVADPAIDALLDKVTGAATRADLTIACRALDRVLRAGRYWIPMWYAPSYRLALWDVFGRPDKPPKYALGTPGLWWFDEARAKRIGRG